MYLVLGVQVGWAYVKGIGGGYWCGVCVCVGVWCTVCVCLRYVYGTYHVCYMVCGVVSVSRVTMSCDWPYLE